MSQIGTLVRSIRLRFLILTPICILLGWSFAIANQSQAPAYVWLLSLFGALLAHIGVNTLNEYADFKSGLDLRTKRTQFSGGSGALPDNPQMAQWVLILAIISLFIAGLIGVVFIMQYGWGLLPIALLGLVLIIGYTPWINQHPLLCLIAPGMGFGVLMVLGANFVLTGGYSLPVVVASLVPFLLINNLLLLNQYPDVEADQAAGRYHFPIAYGAKASAWMYLGFVLLSLLLIVVSVLVGILPVATLIALLGLLPAFHAFSGMRKYQLEIAKHPQYLKSNVLAAVLTPLLLALAIIWS